MTLTILLTLSVLLNLFLFTKIVTLLRMVRNAITLLHEVAKGRAHIDSEGNVSYLGDSSETPRENHA